jgi:hypothetical protein
MPDIEYWKQRARDAENKLLEMGGKAKDGAKRAVDYGKAKVGIDNDEPILPQITEPAGRAVDAARRGMDKGKVKAGNALDDVLDKGRDVLGKGRDAARRGGDMGATAAGRDLEVPLSDQIGEPAGRAVDATRRGVDMGLTRAGADLNEPLMPQAADAVSGLGGKAASAISGGAGDLKNLFLDKVLGQQSPYMYQGAPPAPPAGPAMYGDQSAPSAPSMYGTGQETVGQQPPPNAPSMYGTGQEPIPQPSMYGSGQEAQPYMYNNQPPTMMQRGGDMVNQGRHAIQNSPEAMERALKAAEDAFNRAMGR